MKRVAAKKGFTLMEILVAIAIIAILTAIGIVSYTSINRNARNAKRKSDIEQVRSALELYRTEIGHYPGDGSSVLISDLLANDAELQTYLSSVPEDPKGSTYQQYLYQATDDNGSGVYFGYCVGASMESTDPSYDDTDCDLGLNFTRKQP